MNRGGRLIDSVWQHFYKVESLICGEVRSNCAERMKSHIKQCSKSMKKEVEEEKIEEISAPSSADVQKMNMVSFIVRTNSNSSNKFNILIAKYFYANNIPFSVAEHQTFLDLISLRPGYAPPNRKALSESFLNEAVQGVY